MINGLAGISGSSRFRGSYRDPFHAGAVAATQANRKWHDFAALPLTLV